MPSAARAGTISIDEYSGGFCMNGTVYIPTQFVSRYSLLDAMAAEIGDAFFERGWRVNPASFEGAGPAVFVLLNFPARLEHVFEWIHSVVGDGPAAIVHFYVDHPLALHTPHIDALSALPNYRLLMPCQDDAHLLRLRWPKLRHMCCYHGVAAGSLCDAETIQESHLQPPGEGLGREIPLLIAGSIHTEGELERQRAAIPEILHATCDAIVHLQTAHPGMSFTQAFDLTLPPGAISPDHWQLLTAVWRYTTAALNRARRVELVVAMQGVPAMVVGPSAWNDVCGGTIAYRGEVGYRDLPSLMRRARICLAWGPTQFQHSFSERLLLSMAAGCASVTDDRLVSHAEFASEGAQACLFYSANRPGSARDAVEALLGDPETAAAVGRRGREIVCDSHLWRHRVDTFASAAVNALGTAR